jgi:hypothetical protein
MRKEKLSSWCGCELVKGGEKMITLGGQELLHGSRVGKTGEVKNLKQFIFSTQWIVAESWPECQESLASWCQHTRTDCVVNKAYCRRIAEVIAVGSRHSTVDIMQPIKPHIQMTKACGGQVKHWHTRMWFELRQGFPRATVAEKGCKMLC